MPATPRMEIKVVELVREEWMAALEEIGPRISDEAHRAKWQALRDGARGARGHKIVYINQADHDLMMRYARKPARPEPPPAAEKKSP